MFIKKKKKNQNIKGGPLLVQFQRFVHGIYTLYSF